MFRALLLAALIGLQAPLHAAESSGTNIASVEAHDLATQVVAAAFVSSDTKVAALANFEKEFIEGFKGTENGRRIAMQRPDILSAGLRAGKAEFSRQFDVAVAPAMLRAIAEVYAAKLDVPELRSALAYYRTPQAQRFLASFDAAREGRQAEAAAAAADPVVLGYRSSGVGLKEQAIGGDVADAMMKSMLEAVGSIMPAINQAVRAAMTTQMSKATP